MAMRWIAISLAVAVGLGACSKEEDAREAARKEAEAEDRAKMAAHKPAEVIRPPVPGQTKLPCTQIVDPATYQQALGEKEPMTVKEKGDPNATSSCGLHRGGKRPTEAEQKAILKKEPRLGVLPGDELCHVELFCSTIENAEAFKQRCKDQRDESMGSFACLRIIAQGRDDVPLFRFFDPDTKCLIEVGGGPSNVNGDLIRTCAKVARDTIGPAQIAVGAAPPPAPAPAPTGSAPAPAAPAPGK